MNNLTTVSVTLLQGDNKVMFTESIESVRIDEISGTLAFRILQFRKRVKQFKNAMSIGISFARKFDVTIEINGTNANGSQVMNKGLKFGVTIQDSDKSQNEFFTFISILVDDTLTGKSQLVGTFEELMEEAI